MLLGPALIGSSVSKQSLNIVRPRSGDSEMREIGCCQGPGRHEQEEGGGRGAEHRDSPGIGVSCKIRQWRFLTVM